MQITSNGMLYQGSLLMHLNIEENRIRTYVRIFLIDLQSIAFDHSTISSKKIMYNINYQIKNRILNFTVNTIKNLRIQY